MRCTLSLSQSCSPFWTSTPPQALCCGDGSQAAGDGGEDRLHHRLHRCHDEYCGAQGGQQGYAPDFWISPDGVGGRGRPYPYMIFANMQAWDLLR